MNELDRFQVVIVPELFMISEKEVDALRRYVERGGSLYASRTTSLLTAEGVKKANFLLSDLFGVSFDGETVEELTYMAPTPGNEALFTPYTARYPLTIAGSQIKVKAAKGAQVLATITLPYTDPKDPARFASAISNPPGIATLSPALVLNRFGKGRVLYSAGCLERMEHDAHRVMFRRLVGLLAARPYRVETDAPHSVEITVFEQAAQKRFIVNALNFQADLPSIAVDGVSISIHVGDRTADRLLQLPDGNEIPFRTFGDRVQFTTPRLETFLMFSLGWR